MEKIPPRLCIRSKDISNITGYSMKKSREVLKNIHKLYKKEEHQIVTIHEFSKHIGVPVEQIEPFIN